METSCKISWPGCSTTWGAFHAHLFIYSNGWPAPAFIGKRAHKVICRSMCTYLYTRKCMDCDQVDVASCISQDMYACKYAFGYLVYLHVYLCTSARRLRVGPGAMSRQYRVLAVLALRPSETRMRVLLSLAEAPRI